MALFYINDHTIGTHIKIPYIKIGIRFPIYYIECGDSVVVKLFIFV